MKQLLAALTLALMFSVVFVSHSRADWTKVTKSVSGDIRYVDYERIRKVDGYVYSWDLSDYVKPDEYGTFSAKSYSQIDCTLFRHKILYFSIHKEPMGGGIGEVDNTPDEDWRYPPPGSVMETVLKIACSYK